MMIKPPVIADNSDQSLSLRAKVPPYPRALVATSAPNERIYEELEEIDEKFTVNKNSKLTEM